MITAGVPVAWPIHNIRVVMALARAGCRPQGPILLARGTGTQNPRRVPRLADQQANYVVRALEASRAGVSRQARHLTFGARGGEHGCIAAPRCSESLRALTARADHMLGVC